jgi:hypothetical protein
LGVGISNFHILICSLAGTAYFYRPAYFINQYAKMYLAHLLGVWHFLPDAFPCVPLGNLWLIIQLHFYYYVMHQDQMLL